jgi:cytochrome c-type biogenesis protein CcmH
MDLARKSLTISPMNARARHNGALLIGMLTLAASVASAAPHPAARAVEGRLVAPCCWIQTLDVHESPLADELRLEISTRLERGDTSEAIEDDLAARYGERIRAVPRGGDARNYIPAGVGIGLLLAGLALAALLRRWRRGGQSARVPGETRATQPAAADAYDTRIDAVLADMRD